MSNDLAIEVKDLSKFYKIGARQAAYKTLRESIMGTFAAPIRHFTKNPASSIQHPASDTIWALKNVSFEVMQGEVVGIIGRNGAGKTTLLKILSRITEPTEGRAEIHGRVGSLLEVGTGFHPELTGRENIYLNGAILGMKKTEIEYKFDRIVGFAEIGKFIDTPVKRYSSGMYVRLSFAVAAHLEPDILLVDEVLAVGDTGFQKKCLGKMEDVAMEGRTVLFVSHNMAAIQSLCSRGLVLQAGTCVYDGPVERAVREYIESIQQLVESESPDLRQDRKGGKLFRFQSVEFLDPRTMTPLTTLISGQGVLIRLRYLAEAEKPLNDVVVSIAFYVASGGFLFACRSDAVKKTFLIQPGKGFLDCRIPKWPVSGGRYSFTLMAYMRNSVLDMLKDAGFVDVEIGDYYGTGVLPARRHQGVFIDFDWDG